MMYVKFHLSYSVSCDLQESASEGLLSAGRGVEKGSLQKHPSSSRKLGRQEGDGTFSTVSGSLCLTPGKNKLKDKLSAIRQDRAERRESLQKQDAIHEVDSSEDETDEGSEDSQDGRRGTTFTPPPLLRPTTVRTGPGGTLPSLCLSPCTSHATFSHTGPSHSSVTEPKPSLTKDMRLLSSVEDGAGQERKVPGTGSSAKPSQGPLPFSTPGSAFISVSKDTFLKPALPLDSRRAKTAASEPRPQDQTLESPRTTVPCVSPSTDVPDHRGTVKTADPRSTTGTTDCRTPDSQTPRASCSSPGISKEKKEADNRRLCAAAAAGSSASSPSGSGSSSPVPSSESGMDRIVSQLSTVAKSVLGPVKLSTAVDKGPKDQKPFRGSTPEVLPTDPHHSLHLSETPARQKNEQVASPTTSQRLTKPSAQGDCIAPPPASCKDTPGTPTSGFAQHLSPAATFNINPSSSVSSEPKCKSSDSQTTAVTAVSSTASSSSQQDKATSKET